MKKIVLSIAVLFLISTSVLHAATRDVLAHSSGDWSWFAHVTKVTTVVPPEIPDSNEQTECFALQNAPGQQWRSLATLPGRAVVLAGRSSELAVLMNDGTWLTLWEDGSATGQPLPAGGRIMTLADDGTHLWAIGSVKGGIDEANKAIAQDAAVTQPSTAPLLAEPATNASPVSADLHVVHSEPAKLVLFQEQNGRWATIAEIPADAIITPDEELSLAVVDGQPIVSLKSGSGEMQTIAYDTQHQWNLVIKPLRNPAAANFKILSDGFKPLLWWTSGNEPGVLARDGAGSGAKLDWVSKDQLDGLPSATIAGGYVCVFGPHSGKVLEQRYKMDGTPVETAAEVNVVNDSADSLLPRWLEVVFLTSMGFSVGASVFRQWAEPTKGPAVRPPVPAILLPRLAAGLLDALPVIGALFYLGLKTNAFNDPGKVPTLESIIILASAVAIYILHTTIVETLTARSVGKWVFGLKVVTMDGGVPERSQLLIRNVLRVIDPLVMIIISPQRQRSADAVAGTMVVPLEPLPEPPDEFEDQD